MPYIKQGTITNYDLLEEQIQFYRDHLDIFIEDAFAPIKLKNCQHVMARQIGRCDEAVFVCSRGLGKTWLAALCGFAMCCLYPGTIVVVCSATAAQATLVFSKLRLMVEQNQNMANELTSSNKNFLVQISKDVGKCTFKNGSVMESRAIESMRGLRAKMVIVDEALEVDQGMLDSIVSPLKNYKREISYNYDFKDYPSKTVTITSACEKSNGFYNTFKRVVKDMKKEDGRSFACALNYQTAIDDGITDAEYFEKERAKLPLSVFNMEYNSLFLGSSGSSVFPYALTEKCRTLERIELEQPKNSKSRYVMALDIATSQSDDADNAVLSVIKFMEKPNGTFQKRIVFMRSFHGKSLDVLAEEIRKTFHLKFPNTERILYDARGIGDAFSKFLDEPWTDPTTGKEYPALVHDDEVTHIANALPILHAVRAYVGFNQEVASAMRTSLEKMSIEIPINSRTYQAHLANPENPKTASMEEMAVFYEADALQFELGNIVAKETSSGRYLYDTPTSTMHKDRYSSVSYAVHFISKMEEENVRRKQHGAACIGFASAF
jgi:hypothetical protein